MKLEIANIRIIQDRLVPGGCRLVGWSALSAAFRVGVPLRHLCCVADRHIRGSRKTEGDWEVFDKRYWPGESWSDHLGFALKHEPLDLLLLLRMLQSLPPATIVEYIRSCNVLPSALENNSSHPANRRVAFWNIPLNIPAQNSL